jgi:hypothetical protein
MIEIYSAFYGPVGSTQDKVDVTDKVRNRISTDKMSISMLVSPSSIGVEDKSPNNPKELYVRYYINGIEDVETIRDGSTFNAMVPQEETPSSMGVVFSVIGTIFSRGIMVIFIFLAAVSIGLAFNLGWYVLNPIVWVIVALIVPYASFWAIPVILIWMRIFSSQDFIVLTGGRRR